MNKFFSLILVFPLLAGFYLDSSIELHSFSVDVSDKAIAFASSMEQSVPCATKGIPIEKCSKDIYSHDFSGEIDDFNKINKKIINKTSTMIKNKQIEKINQINDSSIIGPE